MHRSDEAAAIITRTLEALARQVGKTLSAKTRADLARACELLAAGDDYDELLEDLLEQPPIRSERVTQSFDREDYGDPNFGRFRERRQWEEQR